MNGSRSKALKRTFAVWCKLNNYPLAQQKTLFKSFKKRYKEHAHGEGHAKAAKTVSKRRRNRNTASIQQKVG